MLFRSFCYSDKSSHYLFCSISLCIFCFPVTIPSFLPTLEVSVIETCTDDIADVPCVPNINNLDAGDPNTNLFGFRSVPRSASVKLKSSTVDRVFKDPEVKFTYPMKPKDLLSILEKIKHNVLNRTPSIVTGKQIGRAHV